MRNVSSATIISALLAAVLFAVAAISANQGNIRVALGLSMLALFFSHLFGSFLKIDINRKRG